MVADQAQRAGTPRRTAAKGDALVFGAGRKSSGKRRPARANPPKRNSPNNRLPVSEWPTEVFALFKSKLEANRNRDGNPYYVKQSHPNPDLGPGVLAAEQCWVPYKSSFMTVCFEKQQYQRPLHRIAKLLQLLDDGTAVADLPGPAQQCSHLCMDSVNVDGRGARHCLNPRHMTLENDRANKARQRCVGWLYVSQAPHGFWHQSCSHVPPCLRFTAKPVSPTGG